MKVNSILDLNNFKNKNTYSIPTKYVEKEESHGVWVYQFESLTNWIMKRFNTIKEAIREASKLEGAHVILKGKEIKYKKVDKNTVTFVENDTGNIKYVEMSR